MSKAIVLAGGGARGSYHIGAWQALTELGYRPDIVTGTSVGSMNATLVALDWFQEARAMWMSLNDKDVLSLPEKLTSKEVLKFVKQVATDKGLSLDPLEMMITQFLDEDALRKAACRYGLVTVNLNTLTPLELTLDEIPQGQLVDYIMASSACFPLLKPKEIDGHKFIDGGYYDNIPSTLAARMGATEIVEVDLDGIGNDRPLPEEYKDIKITQVKSFHDLGSILAFHPELARRNMELGYLDTYKAFNKLEGWAFAFKLGEIKLLYQKFGAQLFALCETMFEAHPTLLFSYQMYLKLDRKSPTEEIEKFLSVLEGAMLAADLPIGEIYTHKNLKEILLKNTENKKLETFEMLLEDTAASRLLAPIAATDIKKAFLTLLQLVID